MTEFVVLGLGADPRIYGCSPISSPKAQEAAVQYVLPYPEQPSETDAILFVMEFVLELLLEGGIELLFG